MGWVGRCVTVKRELRTLDLTLCIDLPDVVLGTSNSIRSIVETTVSIE